MLKIVPDFVLVRVDSELNTFLGVIKDDDGNDVKLVINPHWQPTQHVRICGEVVAVPSYLSGKDSPLYEIYSGSPKPTSYRGHDLINQQLDLLPPQYRKTTNIPYQCGTYEPQFQTHFGMEIETKVGDKVYFHYLCLLNEANFLAREDDGSLLYLIPYTQLFCYVREGEINMLNCWVLVSEYWDEEAEEIEVGGTKIFGKKKGELVVDLNAKPKYLTGVVQYIGKGHGPDYRQTLPGALVMFRPSSEFQNRIEGINFFCMRQTDLIAEWLSDAEIRAVEIEARKAGWAVEFNKLVPIGDYVIVVPEDLPVSKNLVTHVFDPNKPKQDFKPGEIFVLDSMFSKDKKSVKLNYGKGTVLLSGELCKKDFSGKQICYYISSFYLWVPEFNVALIRYGDIMGTYTEKKSVLDLEV